MAQGWTSLADLRALSRKAWSSGALLRELLEPTGLYPRRRALKRPTAGVSFEITLLPACGLLS